MPHDIARKASLLIETIQTRFHEGHRRAFPELLAMAEAVEASGRADGVVDELRQIVDALEQHMFKEEMRLFPMMEQGGNTLVAQLIEALHAEHTLHGEAVRSLHGWLHELQDQHGPGPALTPLVGAVDALVDELEQHIRAEDGELFPMFLPPRNAVAPRRSPSGPRAAGPGRIDGAGGSAG